VGYRRYHAADELRLARINSYRKAGLSLTAIRQLLDAPDSDLTEALANRMEELNLELRRIRAQQHLILAYLRGDRRAGNAPAVTAHGFRELLDLAGVSPEQRHRLHVLFEQVAAQEHRAFLAFLGLPEVRIGSSPVDP
jgi:hypothetical protein